MPRSFEYSEEDAPVLQSMNNAFTLFLTADHVVETNVQQSTPRNWQIARIDVNKAFMKANNEKPDAYVLPPFWSLERSRFLWLLLSAVYGLVNRKAKR